MSAGFSADFSGSISALNPENNSQEIVSDTSIDFKFSMLIDYPNASCELFVWDGTTLFDLGVNSTVFNDTITTMNANSSFTSSTLVYGLSWNVSCTNSTHSLTSDSLLFSKDNRGSFESTLTDLGTGLGAFLTEIKDPVVDFVLLLAIIGGVVAIFMAVAGVIRKAISRGGK